MGCAPNYSQASWKSQCETLKKYVKNVKSSGIDFAAPTLADKKKVKNMSICNIQSFYTNETITW